jgi:hypothetical protein
MTPRTKLPLRRVLYTPDGRHLLVNGFNGVLYILRLPQDAARRNGK